MVDFATSLWASNPFTNAAAAASRSPSTPHALTQGQPCHTHLPFRSPIGTGSALPESSLS